MKWHETVVDQKTKKIAKLLGGIIKSDYYLAGGTALALQYGHRISLDLDLFSHTKNLDEREIGELVRRIKESSSLKILELRKGTCHLLIEGVAVSFFYYPYELLDQKLLTWNGMSLATPADIASMKLSAILGRGSKKDFVDLYFIAQKMKLEKIFEDSRKKFPDHKDFPLQACRALLFFDDAEQELMPKMLKPVDWAIIRRYFEKEIKSYLNQSLLPR